ENVDAPFSTEKETHFCPGTAGGEEWNSPAYDPRTNLIYVGDVDWCTPSSCRPEKKSSPTRPGKSGQESGVSIRTTRSVNFPVRTATGVDGSTPSTPTRVNGSGGLTLITR